MKILGKFTENEIAQYEKASTGLSDFDRQLGYTKVWDIIKKRIKIPDNHTLIIDNNWNILDKGEKKTKK